MWKSLAAIVFFMVLFGLLLAILQLGEIISESLGLVLAPVFTHVQLWIMDNPFQILIAACIALLVTMRVFYLRRRAAVEPPVPPAPSEEAGS